MTRRSDPNVWCVKDIADALRFIHVSGEQLVKGVSRNQVFVALEKAAYYHKLKRAFGNDEAEIIWALEKVKRIKAEASVTDGIRVKEEDLRAIAKAVKPIREKVSAFGGTLTALTFALADFERTRKEASKEAADEAGSTLQTALRSGYFDILLREARDGPHVFIVLKPEAAWTLSPQLAVEQRGDEFDVVDLRVPKTREYGRVVASGFSKTTSVPSPATGKIAEIVVKIGERVSMGTLIAYVESAASEAPIDITIPDRSDFKDVPVIEILVKEGDTVEAGQPVVTLESDARQNAKEFIVRRWAPPRRCARKGCPNPLEAKRRSMRFCSDACKQAHYRQETQKKRAASVTLKSGSVTLKTDDTPSP
jgi:biotin carboxyl carrier protein